MIDVTQSARDAAAELLGGACPDGVREGKQDSLSLVQAMAAAEQRGMIAARDARKKFPVLGSSTTVDFQLVADHGKQAKTNHSQTVERLAERGGLSWEELHAVLNNQAFRKIDRNTAIEDCRAIEARYLKAIATMPMTAGGEDA